MEQTKAAVSDERAGNQCSGASPGHLLCYQMRCVLFTAACHADVVYPEKSAAGEWQMRYTAGTVDQLRVWSRRRPRSYRRQHLRVYTSRRNRCRIRYPGDSVSVTNVFYLDDTFSSCLVSKQNLRPNYYYTLFIYLTQGKLTKRCYGSSLSAV